MFKNHLLVYRNVSKETLKKTTKTESTGTRNTKDKTKDAKDSEDINGLNSNIITTSTLMKGVLAKSMNFSKSQDDVLGTLEITLPFSPYNFEIWGPRKINVKIVGGVYDSEILFHGRTSNITQDGYELSIELEDPGWKLKEDYDGEDYNDDIHNVLSDIITKAFLKPRLIDIPKEKISRTEVWAAADLGDAGASPAGCVGGYGKCSCGQHANPTGTHYWKSYCPHCKSTNLAFMPIGQWTNPCTSGKYAGGKEGGGDESHIFCCGCDADYCTTCGKEHISGSKYYLQSCTQAVVNTGAQTSTDTTSSDNKTDTSTSTDTATTDAATAESGSAAQETHTYEEEIQKICESRDYQIIVNQNDECIIRPAYPPQKSDYVIQKWMMAKDSFQYDFGMEAGNFSVSTVAKVKYDKGTAIVKLDELYKIYGSMVPLNLSLPKKHKQEAIWEAKKKLYEGVRDKTTEVSFDMLATGKIHPGMWVDVPNPKTGVTEMLWVESVDLDLDATSPFTASIVCKYMPEKEEQMTTGGAAMNPGSLDAIGRAEAKYGDCQWSTNPGSSYPSYMERVGCGDCWADSFWLYEKMYAAGIPARILKCGSHRYVEYNDGTGWKQFPGYTDTGKKWGGKHHGSAACHTTPTIIVPPGTSPENRPGLDHR